jgi:hypothetical protein
VGSTCLFQNIRLVCLPGYQPLAVSVCRPQHQQDVPQPGQTAHTHNRTSISSSSGGASSTCSAGNCSSVCGSSHCWPWC